MAEQMFLCMSDTRIAALIRSARRRVVLASPAFRAESVAALLEAHRGIGSEGVSVICDCDDEVFRLGYGDLSAIEAVRRSGIEVRQSSGLRIGVLVCDERAWVFSPTALYVQAEVHSNETPNAVELQGVEVQRMLWRLQPNSREDAAMARLPADLQREARETDTEIGEEILDDAAVASAKASLEVAPPIPFDISRQVRVFTPYIQYVEISLLGAAIQRRRVELPKELQKLGTTKELEKRLRTTFDLLTSDSVLSSKALEDELATIRNTWTKPLGRPWGRVLLRRMRPEFDQLIEMFREKLRAHQEAVEGRLADALEDSRSSIVELYLPAVMKDTPQSLRAQHASQRLSEDLARRWINLELKRAIPKPADLVKSMRLEVIFRDVTYETLNEEGFFEALCSAYSLEDWDKPFQEFKAAKEGGQDHRWGDA